MANSQDLNSMRFPFDHSFSGINDVQQDYSVISGMVEVVFQNHKAKLGGLFREARSNGMIVFGAVAWLTDFDLLDALASLPANIVVQKEDFLRPDTPDPIDRKRWKANLRAKYEKIEGLGMRYWAPGALSETNYLGDPGIEGVRCVGNHNSARKSAFPRMHNKFLVFCEYRQDDEEIPDGNVVLPKFVWTGSYNLTKNATDSWENVVIIRDHVIAEAYANEWAQLMVFSEPLDWDTDWVAPEYRIGS